MKICLIVLIGALLSANLAGCASYSGEYLTWKPGNPKFTTGLSAPQPVIHKR